jgi:hypothetical protein
MIDKEGIVWGVMISLAVQGLYDVLFYWLGGKIVEEWMAFSAAFLTLLFIASLFYLIGSLKGEKYRRQKKQAQGSEVEEKSEDKKQVGKWKKWLKKTENMALVLSILALSFTAVNTYREWYPLPQRAKLTVFIEGYGLYQRTADELNFDIWGKVVNDSPLTALIRRWGLVLSVNTTYTIMSSRFNMPDLSLYPSEQVNYTMGHVLWGDNQTRIPETAIKGCIAWFEYQDALGLQITQAELTFQ